MIRYALKCETEHAFEAWFSNSSDYDAQAARGLVECPYCGSHRVEKAIMAPAIKRSDRSSASPDTARETQILDERAEMYAQMREHLKTHFAYVGPRFAEEARRRHEGGEPADSKPIYGEATAEEARALIEDGVPVAPLPDAATPEGFKRLQ